MADEQQLGVTFTLSDTVPQHRVGVRYWNIDHTGTLTPPLRGSQSWVPGLNTGYCGSSRHHEQIKDDGSWKLCTCGLYCFDYEPGIFETSYFDLRRGRADYQQTLGAIAYWGGVSANRSERDIVRAQYASVAALMHSPWGNIENRRRVEQAAERYDVQIVRLEELYDAVDDWVQNKLPIHATSPVKKWTFKRSKIRHVDLGATLK